MSDETADATTITCQGCGKRFKWKLQLAGKRVKCSCGTVMLVPRRAAEAEDIYDLFEGQAQEAPPIPRVAAAVGADDDDPQRGAVASAPPTRASGPSKSAPKSARAEEIAARLGIALPTRKRLDYAESVKAGREEMDRLAQGSFLRDIIAPIPIIVVGLILSYLQVSYWADKPARGAAEALMQTASGAALSVGLILFSMFFLTRVADVNFMGSFARCILRLVAIAIGPAAIYHICVYTLGSDTMGAPFTGVLATIALYLILFLTLMRTDLKDAGICALVTWILVTLANYAAFKAEAMMMGYDI
ncbi:MAG TPA: hypothetical protein VH475_28645 [Tepidisphaeraceae bacterium]|jgi:hypothetical protein